MFLKIYLFLNLQQIHLATKLGLNGHRAIYSLYLFD